MLSHLKKDDNSYDVFYQNLLEYTKVGERMKHISFFYKHSKTPTNEPCEDLATAGAMTKKTEYKQSRCGSP